jgi:hypothetical protein
MVGIAAELFEFGDPESVISKRLQDSLRVVLAYGAKVTYIASIDDQLVAMEVRLPQALSSCVLTNVSEVRTFLNCESPPYLQSCFC